MHQEAANGRFSATFIRFGAQNKDGQGQSAEEPLWIHLLWDTQRPQVIIHLTEAFLHHLITAEFWD